MSSASTALSTGHAAQPLFTPLSTCWICGNNRFRRLHEAPLDFTNFAEQDPELHECYSGQTVWFGRCENCGFTQPQALPALPHFFDRLYDIRWGGDWLEKEFEGTCKDLIFTTVLKGLEQRLPSDRRHLLDVGAHVGRFIYLAKQAGWLSEGIELNPRTAAFAAQRSGCPVHRINAHELADQGRRYDAITLIDVLEHIPEPLPVLRALHRLLDPGGWIVVKVPCGPSQLLKERLVRLVRRRRYLNVATNLVHINHFHPPSLKKALETAGFRDVKVIVGAPELPTHRSYLRKCIARFPRLSCYYLSRTLPGGLRTPLAFNLQAFARKAF
jgi:2-polyprenyl-3-methyl-5-hydroxy-6-metoxy-1,4-benzoquinol methylase